MSEYRSWRGLPALAGIATMEEAMRPGLSVEECVGRLKRYHYAFKRLAELFLARLTAEPVYELKMAFSLHAHLCAEQVAALRTRVGEMREPPLGLEKVPDPGLELLFDEVLAAGTTGELLAGVHEVALPALVEALDRHRAETNPLADHPSARLCKLAAFEMREVLEYGARAVAALVSPGEREEMGEWIGRLRLALASAGGMDGAEAERPPLPARMRSATPHQYDPKPRRDERFPDPYNMGVNAEVFLYDPAMPPKAKTLMMFYKRLREIDVPEMMASILVETKGKPWGYYRDMIRQLWDEARHAMMGEVGFVNLGVDWRKVMVNFTWSLSLNKQLAPRERHAVLYFIEQGLMPKTGKRHEWEVGLASKNPLSALFQDYDWADEVLHARVGRDWYLKEFDDPKVAVEYGDKCWSKVLMGWEKWREEGLTEHRNWWPDLYLAACERWGEKPDPRVLAYNTSYQSVRADLKNLAVSG